MVLGTAMSIWDDWSPRELAALKRATAKLMASQEPEQEPTNLVNHEYEKRDYRGQHPNQAEQPELQGWLGADISRAKAQASHDHREKGGADQKKGTSGEGR